MATPTTLPAKTFTATHRMARISPYKARPVMNLVRGKNVRDAIRLLEFEPRRAASMIKKVLKSAVANASNDLDVKLDRLVVAEALIDGGPLLSGRARFRPGPMGRAMPIRKRTCHIVIRLREPAGVPAGGESAGSAESAAAPAAAKPATSKKKPAKKPAKG